MCRRGDGVECVIREQRVPKVMRWWGSGGGVEFVGIFSIAKAFSKIFGAILCLFVLVSIVNMTSLVIRKYSLSGILQGNTGTIHTYTSIKMKKILPAHITIHASLYVRYCYVVVWPQFLTLKTFM